MFVEPDNTELNENVYGKVILFQIKKISFNNFFAENLILP